MLKTIIILNFLILFTGCSNLKGKKRYLPSPDDSPAVLNLSHSSYVKGCVDAYHSMGVKKIFFDCSKKATEYINEIRPILVEEK